jgi:hypothetical protein
MQNTLPNWEELIRIHKDYEGTIIDFCKIHNINKNSFYYYRKKFGAVNKRATSSTFRKIEVNHTTSTEVTTLSRPNMIIITIGNATMTITDTIDTRTLTTIMKALASC